MTETTTIKVRYADKKIKFTKERIQLFHEWDAPRKYKQLKRRCMSMLADRVVFLKDNSDQGKLAKKVQIHTGLEK